MERTFENPTTEDEAWISLRLRRVSELLGIPPTELPSLSALDSLFERLVLADAPQGEQVTEVLECVGAAFGAHLVQQLGFAWCICTDEWGTDIAVRASPGRADVTIVPVDLVAKRWDRRETSFIVLAVKEIESTLTQIVDDYPPDS